MIKKEYQKPTIKVYELQHKCRILAGSGPRTLNGTSEEYEDLE